MTKYLLDSTVLIDWLRGQAHAVQALQEWTIAGEEVAVNAISLAETFSGIRAADRDATERLFSGFLYWLIDAATARLAGDYRFDYARRGRSLSVTDALMAAHAVSLDATLVTGNVKDFPMPELKLLKLP